MGKGTKPGPAKVDARVAFDPRRHIDTGDPSIDDAGKGRGEVARPFKNHGDPSPDGGFTVASTQVHLPDVHRGEDEEDDRKKRDEEKARQAELLGDARGEQAEHFGEHDKQHLPAPDDTSPPKPNERIGRVGRTRG